MSWRKSHERATKTMPGAQGGKSYNNDYDSFAGPGELGGANQHPQKTKQGELRKKAALEKKKANVRSEWERRNLALKTGTKNGEKVTPGETGHREKQRGQKVQEPVKRTQPKNF